jgi:hypothetical protein
MPFPYIRMCFPCAEGATGCNLTDSFVTKRGSSRVTCLNMLLKPGMGHVLSLSLKILVHLTFVVTNPAWRGVGEP